MYEFHQLLQYQKFPPLYSESFWLLEKAISYYLPDFIIETDKGFYVVETKGAETIDVELKDKRAEEWCNDASKLTGKKWKYIKVKQRIFDENQNIRTFAKLVELIEAYQLATNY